MTMMMNRYLSRQERRQGRIQSRTVGSKRSPLLEASETASFRFVVEQLRRHRGFDVSLYRPGTLQRRIRSRFRATGCADYEEYLSFLHRHPEEYDALIDVVTINVTEYFRDPETFEALRTMVIPELIRTKTLQKRRIIRVWSAGTSDGAEAYSVAMLFLDVLNDRIHEFQISIYGTDVDAACLARAVAGRYDSASLRQVPAAWRARYFRMEAEGCVVTDPVKALTRFQSHNLVSDPGLPHMDLILCRNVLIYFTRPLQASVYARFAESLNDGGFLVLGKVESLWGASAACFEAVDIRERIYQMRKGAGP